MMQSSEVFPFDALDTIFCFACERKRDAAGLAIVCRFWHDRFVHAERLWESLIPTNTRLRHPPGWSINYDMARKAGVAAMLLRPLPVSELLPMVAISPTSSCPLYTQACRYVASNELFCDGCGVSVHLVEGDYEESAMRRLGGHVARVPNGLLNPVEVKSSPSQHGMVLASSRQELEIMMREIAVGYWENGATISPYLTPSFLANTASSGFAIVFTSMTLDQYRIRRGSQPAASAAGETETSYLVCTRSVLLHLLKDSPAELQLLTRVANVEVLREKKGFSLPNVAVSVRELAKYQRVCVVEDAEVRSIPEGGDADVCDTLRAVSKNFFPR